MIWICLDSVAFAAFVIGAIAMWGMISKIVGLPPW